MRAEHTTARLLIKVLGVEFFVKSSSSEFAKHRGHFSLVYHVCGGEDKRLDLVEKEGKVGVGECHYTRPSLKLT